jgi:hypothetical protein
MLQPISTTIILLAITLFCLGILLGWVMSNHAELSAQHKLKTMVAIVVTLGWITATISGILIATYTVSPLLHALMGAIVGYFFTDDGINLDVGGGK